MVQANARTCRHHEARPLRRIRHNRHTNKKTINESIHRNSYNQPPRDSLATFELVRFDWCGPPAPELLSLHMVVHVLEQPQAFREECVYFGGF
jgi:hypothetical protein